ncbi:MAG: VCBS repeat-containing protein [Planctomycetaceae bacterium]|nr:VCBS repeat-containing protein [Planctomycetaceae bacterium]MCA9044973.1 VCBS repeat-containing protein [Planctomycetaceae bacterium]
MAKATNTVFGLKITIGGLAWKCIAGRPKRRKRSLDAPHQIQALEEKVLLTSIKQVDTLVSNPETLMERYGESVAMSNNYYAVGAPGTSDYGSVYVHDAATGDQLWQLKNPLIEGIAGDTFGERVAVSGSLVVTGDENSAAVFVFDATTGQLLHTLNPRPIVPESDREFGRVFAAADGIIAVSETEFGDEATRSFVHLFNANTGEFIRTLYAPYIVNDTTSDEVFGNSLALSGNHIAVGASLAGKVFIFDITDGTLARTLYSPQNGNVLGYFGEQLALRGDTVAVSDEFSGTAYGEGVVYIYSVAAGGPSDIIHNPHPIPFGNFGQSIGLSDNNTLVVAAPGNRYEGNAGSVYVCSIGTGEVRHAISVDYQNQLPWGLTVSVLSGKILVGKLHNDPPEAGGVGHVAVYTLQGDDLLVFDAATGRWKLGRNQGADFSWTNGPKWNPASNWRTFTGDYNGDGLLDGIGINSSNSVFFARNNGDGTMTTVSAGSFSSLETFQHIMVGDFNGDGRADLIAQQATKATTPLAGSWFVKSWSGSAFSTSFYGRWEAAGWIGFGVGDVNHDGVDDIIGLRNAEGLVDRVNWLYGISNEIPDSSRRLFSQFAGAFNGRQETNGWTPIVGDWDGDGRTDVAARKNDGRFVYGTASGGPTAFAAIGANRLVNSNGPLFSPSFFSGAFYVADFTGDGRDDILGRQDNNRNLWVAETSNMGQISGTVYVWAIWNGSTNWLASTVGDFDHDGLADYASIDIIGVPYASLTTGMSSEIIGADPITGPLRFGSGRLF